MNRETADLASDLFAHQSRTVRGRASGTGLHEGWAAPVAVFDAPDGFGEQAWLNEIPSTVLATRLKGAQVICRWGKHTGRRSGPYRTTLQPKGLPNHFSAHGAIRFAQVYLRDSLIDRVADGIRPEARASGVLRDDIVFVNDHELDRRMANYVLLSCSSSGASALELEAEAILLVGYLLRVHHGFGGKPKPARGGLAPWQLQRAIDAIQAHLDEDIGLDRLAGIAGCSPTHFSRAFKQSTGMPPFQWLLERRIERAQALLADSKIPLAEVALAVGFAAQPQFTTAFRRATGQTPGAWRRDRVS